jgi:hypothetical protein
MRQDCRTFQKQFAFTQTSVSPLAYAAAAMLLCAAPRPLTAQTPATNSDVQALRAEVTELKARLAEIGSWRRFQR